MQFQMGSIHETETSEADFFLQTRYMKVYSMYFYVGVQTDHYKSTSTDPRYNPV